MKKPLMAALVLGLVIVLVGCGEKEDGPQAAEEDTGAAVAEPAAAAVPGPDEQVADLDRMCTDAMGDMVARQAERTLFDRIGGRDGIRGVVAETVRLHQENDAIKHLLEGVDTENLVALVTDFLVVGTGGEGEYGGRDMAEAHAHLGLSNADFLAAGGDLGMAMEAAGWGENERQEVLCAFVALRAEVVTQ